MFDDITLLEILAGIGVIAAIYIAFRLSKIIEYIENTQLQQHATRDSKAEVKRLVESYLGYAHDYAEQIEYFEAMARYRRLADRYVQNQFNDPDRENDGYPWNQDDERDHAMNIAELRHKKYHFERLAISAGVGFPVPKEPWESLKDLEELKREKLLKDFPLPLTPRRVAGHKRAEEAIEKGKKMRMEAERAKDNDNELRFSVDS